MTFKKKLKVRLAVAVVFLLLGICLLAAAALQSFENEFYLVYGIALIGTGIARLIWHIRITRSEETIRSRELAESDERFRMISHRARSWAYSFSLMAAGLVVIVMSLMGKQDAAQPFAWYICGMVLLYWCFWALLQKKY